MKKKIIFCIIIIFLAMLIIYKMWGKDYIGEKKLRENITNMIDESDILPYEYSLSIDYLEYASTVYIVCDEFANLSQEEQIPILKKLKEIIMANEYCMSSIGQVLSKGNFYAYNGESDVYICSEESWNRTVTKVQNESQKSKISDDIKAICWVLATNEVKENLKAPSTAEFPSTYNSQGVEITCDGIDYYVSSYVDSENSFGANLRTNFVVTIGESNGEYYVKNIFFDE